MCTAAELQFYWDHRNMTEGCNEGMQAFQEEQDRKAGKKSCSFFQRDAGVHRALPGDG